MTKRTNQKLKNTIFTHDFIKENIEDIINTERFPERFEYNGETPTLQDYENWIDSNQGFFVDKHKSNDQEPNSKNKVELKSKRLILKKSVMEQSEFERNQGYECSDLAIYIIRLENRIADLEELIAAHKDKADDYYYMDMDYLYKLGVPILKEMHENIELDD